MERTKPVLFTWHDFMVPTGFGIVNEQLLDEMHKNFDVYVLAINYHGMQAFDTDKYRMVYPISQDDPLGFKRMQAILPQIKPDVIFLHQDIFHIDRVMQIIQQAAPQAKVVIHFPVDGQPFSTQWKKPLLHADKVFTYSEFGVDAIERTFPELAGKNIVDVLYCGADKNVFKPISRPIRRKKLKDNGWADKFIAVNINRFQPRKMLGLTSRAFLMFAKGYHICECGNWYPTHLNWCDLNMCKSDKIVETHEGVGEKNTSYYIHCQPMEMAMGNDNANTLPAHIINAGYTEEDFKSGLIAFNQKNIYAGEVPVSFMNELYNMACVNISGSIGEGAGMSLLEAQAVGTTCIAPKNSAIPEVLGEDTGHHLLNNVGLIEIALDNGHKRPIFDLREMVKALQIEYKKWEDNGRKKVINQAAIDRVTDKFSWEDKRNQLLQALS